MKYLTWVSWFFVLMVMVLFTFGMVNSFAAKDDGTIVLSSTNSVGLLDEVNENSVGKTITRLYELDKLNTSSPIYLVLYTPGGSIEDGLLLMTVARGLRRPVHTITIFAASMGFQIVQALGDRYITQYGTLMSHKAKGSFSGEFPGQVQQRLNFWLDRVNEMDKTTVERTKGKQTLASYQTAYENELWLTGNKAVDQGYADRITNVKCDSTLMGTHKESVQTIFGDITVIWSDCPMITQPIRIELPKVEPPKKDYLEFLINKQLNERKQPKKSY